MRADLKDNNDAAEKWALNKLADETGTAAIDICPNHVSKDLIKDLNERSASWDAIRFLLDNLPETGSIVKLLVPLQTGYIIQSDFLERRMVDCPYVVKIQCFVAPSQYIRSSTTEAFSSMSISNLLPHCYGAVVIKADSPSSAATKSASIDAELEKRIAFPWLAPGPIPRKRLALVGAGSFPKVQGYLLAAISLNISLVAFDDASHWMSDDTYGHLREEFVPLNMDVTEDMAQYIARSLQEYQKSSPERKRIDGIISVDEHLHSIIAVAATHLGFNTSPPESVSLAQNKFRTRQLDNNVFCRLVRTPEELEKLISEDGQHFSYPLIVKPSKGWSSEGVWKVANEQELREKVPLLWRDSFTAWHGRDIVIETYIDGPEVDANMVLVDGEIAFFEVNDDFPSAGDGIALEANTRVPNFVETSNMLPSFLPPFELASLRQRLHELALAAGFRNAVLHIEAKLRNSSCHYALAPDSGGLIDLQLKTPAATTTTPNDVFLLEINPRAPGWQEVDATARAYGVSYYSIILLNALADKDRILALSRPFQGGSQYNMQLLFVSAQKGGIYKSGDICTKVLQQDPQNPSQEEQLGPHVVQCANLMEDGEEVLDPRTGQVYGNFIAFFLVISRESRKEAIRIGQEIERRVRQLTDGF
ncbi:hypothetical protein N7494_000907 [Penicillium frequentans]|uniref:ATP-grasp domain-containing protein n=1 Tax=Penicillium frequentans TaxID=3151616 RepID=A0AAD6D919_9EURO|nr:hypothetical protein N7494_000907 [Penicillium glabrum]